MKKSLIMMAVLLMGVMSVVSMYAGNGVSEDKASSVLYESAFDVEGTAVNNY